MARPLNEIIALRRLARVYRRLLLLAVPAALAGCGDGGDALAPESDAGPAETAPVPVFETAAGLLNRIAFVTRTDNGSDIWSMSPTGTNQKRMTSFSGQEFYPIWAPDHGRIAFSRMRNGHAEIYLMKADGTNGHWALPTASTYSITAPSWAPDGKSILAQIWVSGPYIGKVDLATGQWTHLAPAGYYGLPGRNPIYSKDGTWIYYLTQANKQVRRFQPLGQDVLVKSFTSAVDALALSPDGTKLAYLSYATGNNEIYVLTLATGQTKRLTYDSHQDTDPAWSPDGTRIAFASDRSGQRQIYTMNSADGGNVIKLTSKTYGVDHPSWYR
jgi:Tol biopolymer transport system component